MAIFKDIDCDECMALLVATPSINLREAIASEANKHRRTYDQQREVYLDHLHATHRKILY